MTPPLRLGTRGSALALAQARSVAAGLGASVEIIEIRTDEAALGDKARFVRAIDRALLAGEVDLAVHSAKDVPGELPEGLEIVAVPSRENPADAFVGQAASLAAVPSGGTVGTSSLRRRAQLLALRPDLCIVEIRGNVDTRLRRLAEGQLEGLVLALAGLARLGRREEASFLFDEAEMTPAPGQGALAIEARSGDARVAEAVSAVADAAALAELSAERTVVAELDASCHTPVGVRARVDGAGLTLSAFAGLPDGSEWVRDALAGDADRPVELGRELAARMIAAGARDVLERAERATA